jgi:hypothetical protein
MKSPKGRGQKDATDFNMDDYAVVCFVEDIDQANERQALLESNDIPAFVQGKEASGDENTFAVFVPEERLDEAQELIEAQITYDDYYDFPFDDEGDEDFDPMYDEPY